MTVHERKSFSSAGSTGSQARPWRPLVLVTLLPAATRLTRSIKQASMAARGVAAKAGNLAKQAGTSGGAAPVRSTSAGQCATFWERDEPILTKAID